MKDHVLKGRVAVVAVRAPTAGPQVHFDISAARRTIAHLHERAAKVRPALEAAKARMKNAQRLSV